MTAGRPAASTILASAAIASVPSTESTHAHRIHGSMQTLHVRGSGCGSCSPECVLDSSLVESVGQYAFSILCEYLHRTVRTCAMSDVHRRVYRCCGEVRVGSGSGSGTLVVSSAAYLSWQVSLKHFSATRRKPVRKTLPRVTFGVVLYSKRNATSACSISHSVVFRILL